MAALARDLAARGALRHVSSPWVFRALARQSSCVYLGIDATGASLHAGHLMPLVTAARFALHGHRVLAVIGTATAAVGDPTGRTAARSAIGPSTLAVNAGCVRGAVERVLKNLTGKAYSNVEVLENGTWLNGVKLVDFLLEHGRHAPVTAMLQRTSASLRLKSIDNITSSSEGAAQHADGLTFAGLGYQLLQAYDFLYLHKTYGCQVQLGGADQWGNIVAGLDLIRRTSKDARQVYGVTVPLLTHADGRKIGKSDGTQCASSVWLDSKLTPAPELYQYFCRLSDAEAIKLSNALTTLPLISQSCKEQQAQKKLAHAVTAMVHGDAAADHAKRVANAVFRQRNCHLSPEKLKAEIEMLQKSSQSDAALAAQGTVATISRKEISKCLALDLYVKTGLCSTRSQAKKKAAAGALRLNGTTISTSTLLDSLDDAETIVLRSGKLKHKFVVLQ